MKSGHVGVEHSAGTLGVIVSGIEMLLRELHLESSPNNVPLALKLSLIGLGSTPDCA